MKRISIIILGLVVFSANGYSQNFLDAYRYSANIYSGTARFTGMAGSFGALGGDFSTSSVNPAGLGTFRANDFSFTPTFSFNNATSKYLGNSGTDNRFAFGIGNIGLVTTFRGTGQSDKTSLVNFNFGVGYNKLRDYNSNVYTTALNTTSSITDQFAADANALVQSYGLTSPDMLTIPDPYNSNLDPFVNYGTGAWPAILAWNSFLVDALTDGSFTSPLLVGEAVYQSNSISTKGSLGEYTLSFAGNVSDKFYFGGTIGIQDLYYSKTSEYTEDIVGSSASGFQNLLYRQTLETVGSGYNFKLGFIYKPIQRLRVGVAFHTPTFFDLKDSYNSYMSSQFDVGYADAYSPNGEYDYSLITPYRFIGSVAYLYQDKLAINVDYERVNYPSMKLRDGGDGYSFHVENNEITQTFNASNNIRVGAEFHQGALYFRGGYAFYGTPYKSGYYNDNANTTVIAAGVGLRSSTFYMDFAFNNITSKNESFLYGNQDVVKDTYKQNQVVFTLGYRF
jgi:hypothetical protein